MHVTISNFGDAAFVRVRQAAHSTVHPGNICGDMFPSSKTEIGIQISNVFEAACCDTFRTSVCLNLLRCGRCIHISQIDACFVEADVVVKSRAEGRSLQTI